MRTDRLHFWVLFYYLLNDFDLFLFGPYRGIYSLEADGAGIMDNSSRSQGKPDDIQRHKLLTALQYVEKIQRQMSKSLNCTPNQSVILDIAFQHARWKSEALLAVKVANLLTSLWRVRNANGSSMAENDTFLYNLVRSNVLFSPSVFGSVICFEKNQYRDYVMFCPYAFRDKNYGGAVHVKDISVGHNYLTSPETIWWREPREINLRRSPKLRKDKTDIYTVRHNQTTAESRRNVSVPVVEYDADGFWTRPYFDCFGGEIWMITFLAPFFNESNQFLGVVSIDVELSSIDINQCDAQDSTEEIGDGKNGKSDRTGSTDSVKLLEFMGTHKCKKSTKCEPIPNNGFKRGSYRCTCKPGFYFPDINANLKAFNGSIIEEEYDKKMKGLQTDYDDKFHCIPCSEGCEECTDGSPCIYKEQIIPRIVLIGVNGLAAMMAIMIGVMVFYLRDSKVFDVASPVFLEILLLGSVFMYSSLAAAYVGPSSLTCTIEIWLYQCGFFVVYGTIVLKMWRVSASFRVRSPRRVEVTEGMMAGRLIILFSCLVIYLLVWTLLMPPHVITNTSVLRFKQCSLGDMNYVNFCGNFILLAVALFLCVRVRNAPSAYNETRFTTWAVYNAMFVTCFVAVLRILTANNTNSDILFATKFILIQMTATVTLLLLFIPKLVLLRKMRGKEFSRRLTEISHEPRSSIQTSNGSYLHDVSSLERENEDLKEEVKRLANKVANLQSRLMKDKNKHIKSASNSLSRIRSSTNDEHCDDHTQKKMSSSPFSSFLNSRV